MLNNEEQHLLLNHIDDLVKESEKKRDTAISDFLTLQESSTVVAHLHGQKVQYKLLGGYEEAERKLIAIYPSIEETELVESDWISYIKVEPKSLKFGKKLTHRDYLGALMNLGIERRVLGDLLMDDQVCTVVCKSHIADFIIKTGEMILPGFKL